MTTTAADIEVRAAAFRECFAHLQQEIGRVFVGQPSVVDRLLLCFFCQGHALIEGPPAYPLPQIEFAYLFPQLAMGGWLVLDDLQIPSVHELFKFVKSSGAVALEEVVGRTAFFRRTQPGGNGASGPDGWWLQNMNRSLVWRYSWRDRLRKLLRRRADV
jgi:hypothetical protein